MDYFLLFVFSFLLAAVAGAIAMPLARRLGLIDVPRDRHQHDKATPLLGGLTIFVSFLLVMTITYEHLMVGDLTFKHWLGVLMGATLVVIGGLLDDKYNLPPVKQLIFPVLACIAVVWGGVSVEKISNPLGGFWYLPVWLSAIFIACWLMGMMYTTKLLDGLDGLVGGIGTIASFIIFLFTMTTRWHQPDIGWASLALAGACAGFLYWNWHPAKMFLGESGAMLIGFLLGVLSIISGGKIAVALLIMGIPIMDVAWTIIRRLLAGKNPLRAADRQHLHFRLLSAGLSVRQAAGVFYVFAAVFGLAALFLQSRGKLFLLLILAIFMLVGLFSFNWLDKKATKG